MTVSIEATSRKYHGAMAANYETNRRKQERWDIENAEVTALLTKLKPKTVLDVPVGTGRFLPIYDHLDVRRVLGVDISDEMLAQARQKIRKIKRMNFMLVERDVLKLKAEAISEVSVCVRFLDLIDEEAMRNVMRMLFKLTQRAIICTIRFGPEYVPKSNTAEHDEAKFRALVTKNGWKIAKAIPVFKQGWHVLLLKPR